METPTDWQPRRRADDWHDRSAVSVRYDDFFDLVAALGYQPEAVLSIRVNHNECIVTWTEPTGMPRSTRHPVVP